MTTASKSKPFSLGEIVATKGAIAAMEAAGDSPLLFLLRTSLETGGKCALKTKP